MDMASKLIYLYIYMHTNPSFHQYQRCIYIWPFVSAQGCPMRLNSAPSPLPPSTSARCCSKHAATGIRVLDALGLNCRMHGPYACSKQPRTARQAHAVVPDKGLRLTHAQKSRLTARCDFQ